jgi:hypothetical protein
MADDGLSYTLAALASVIVSDRPKKAGTPIGSRLSSMPNIADASPYRMPTRMCASTPRLHAATLAASLTPRSSHGLQGKSAECTLAGRTPNDHDSRAEVDDLFAEWNAVTLGLLSLDDTGR